jgi:Tol biopolymer transport system component
MMRRLLLLALAAFPLALVAQGRVTVTDDVSAQVAAQRITVQLSGTDAALTEQVRQALSLHGAFTVSTASGVRVSLDRAGNGARVACAQPGYAFETEVQGRDVGELALRAADAAVTGLGRRFNLRPLFADTRVAFLSRTGPGRHEILAGNLLMRGVRPLTRLNCDNLGPRWSADGNRVFFVSYAKGVPDLYTAPYPFGESRAVIAGMRGTLSGGAASPDGRRLAFSSSNLGKTLDLYVADINGGARRCIVQSADRVESDAAWSPDGAQIVFAAGAGGSPRLHVVPAAGGTPTQLATGGGYASEPSWNAVDRNLIAFTQAGEGTNSVAVLNLSQGTVAVAGQGTSAVAHSRPSWCADGRHLVVQSQRRGTDAYWLSLVDSVTGKVSRLTGEALPGCKQPDCWFPRR